MKLFIIVMAVGSGGAIGALSRHLLVALFHRVMDMPTYVAVMIINILGCFLIGIAFFLIEALLKKDIESPLKATSMSKPLRDIGWWPKSDPTQPVVRDFAADLKAELLAAFIITGILGGMTTFSLFSLLSLQLQQSGNYLGIAINIVGTITIGFIATVLGLYLGRWITIRGSRN